MSIAVLEEPGYFATNIDLKEGVPLRCGPDEDDVMNVPTNINCSTELPGGFGPGTVVVPRPDNFDPLSFGRGLLMGARTYDEANRTVHEGRITGQPHIGVDQIEIELEGWSQHGGDNEAVKFLGIDRDMGHWQNASAQRKKNLYAAGIQTLDDAGTTTDLSTGGPALQFMMDGPWPGQIRSITQYLAGAGLGIGSLYYAWQIINSIGAADANWALNAHLGNDDMLSSLDLATTSPIGATGSNTLNATTQTRTVAELDLGYAAAQTGSPHAELNVVAAILKGTHGLTTQGTGTAQGLLVSDMVAYLVSKFAPLWNVAPGAIEPTSFWVPQAEWRTDTTVTEIIEALLLLGGTSLFPLDWGVYEGRGFWMASPGNYGATYYIRADEGSEPAGQGPDGQERINGVKAVYSTGAGQQQSVGPPGSMADIESIGLMDLTETNPANRMGAPRYKLAQMGVSSAPGATLLAQLVLAEKNRQEWRGDVTAKGDKGFVRDASGAEEPYYMIRAADQTVVEDDRDGDTRPRRIIGTSFDSSKRENALTVGADPDRFDVLLAQAGIEVSDISGG